jgi:transposase
LIAPFFSPRPERIPGVLPRMTSKGQEKMSQAVAPTSDFVTIGIDVSKRQLDVHLHPSGITQRFANDPAGRVALLAWMAPHRPMRVVFEASGAYHRDLEEALAKAALVAVKVNPWHARRFAEALGQRAKTDAVDAAMLARFAATLRPEPKPAPHPAVETLRQLMAARTALIKDRTAARNRAHIRALPLLKAQCVERLDQIAAQIKAIDGACRAVLERNPTLQQRYVILTSIRGIGPVTAFALLAEMPELGVLDAKQAASLAGLAPIARQSGARQGKRFIQGGRKAARDALYMPALVAIRFNAPLKAKYEAMIAAGKPAKVAIVTVMRKLLVLANALLRDGRNWTQQAPTAA